MNIDQQINNRKTFAIISHPDAGKTTLTEKFLLFGGAIHIAGAVKAKKTNRYASSDFMEIERQRGISVATSVMGFEYQGIKINLLDTPGHQDFCEDTYRTLTAVDSTVMVIDAVRGVQEQTYKLLDVCRMRKTPVITFINKLDREGKSSIELLDEIEKKLKITIVPLSWPIGMGKGFKGVYSLYENRLLLFKPHQKQDTASIEIKDLADPLLDQLLKEDAAKLREEIELIKGVYPKFSKEDYLSGKVTPVFFGSALNNFGVKELLDCFIQIAPTPLARETDKRLVQPNEPKFSGFVFKIHANIDPKHRDRIAFLRVCSGKFERNKWYYHVQSNKNFRTSNPTAFMASERTVIDEAYPGDIIGLHDTGTFKIGDTLTEGEKLIFKGIPSFSPEIFRLVVNQDPMKTKQLNLGLTHLCEEGLAQLFTSDKFAKKVLGTVGPLQFEVIQYRLLKEYGANCRFDELNFIKALWLQSENKEKLNSFIKSRYNQILFDKNNHPVYLASTKWSLDREIKENPDISFLVTSEA